MTIDRNRLTADRPQHFPSAFRALEYARGARERGLMLHAAAWERADLEGWDDLHFSEDHRRAVFEKATQSKR